MDKLRNFLCKIGIHKYGKWIFVEMVDDGPLKRKKRYCRNCNKKHEGTFGFLLAEPF